MFLDPYDSHLDLVIAENGLTVGCLHQDGFQSLWKGGRTNYGVKKGVWMYEVKVLEHLEVQMPEQEQENPHVLKCGFSQPESSLFLGDTAQGWAWDSTGKKYYNGTCQDFSGKINVGDVVGCILDMDQRSISFTKNGSFVGMAYDNVPRSAQKLGIFPHILLKNVKVQLNFRRESKWFDAPGTKVKFYDEAPDDVFVENPVTHPVTQKEAEFVMMCGLPACGKSYWTRRHISANPLKNYVLLGVDSVIEQMRLNLSGDKTFAGRWPELLKQATPIFNLLVDIAGKTPRNVILDQTNVYRQGRRRKAAPFKSFGRRVCMTMVNTEDVLAVRTENRQHEEGKFVAVSAVNEMRAHFIAPQLEDGFTEISFTEFPEEEAREMIRQIRIDGLEWLRANPSKMKKKVKPVNGSNGTDGARDRSRSPPTKASAES